MEICVWITLNVIYKEPTAFNNKNMNSVWNLTRKQNITKYHVLIRLKLGYSQARKNFHFLIYYQGDLISSWLLRKTNSSSWISHHPATSSSGVETGNSRTGLNLENKVDEVAVRSPIFFAVVTTFFFAKWDRFCSKKVPNLYALSIFGHSPSLVLVWPQWRWIN